MSEPIKVGDLVMVLDHCCEQDTLGHITTVSSLFQSNGRCITCNTAHYNTPAALLDGTPHSFRVSWLKRIPPLAEMERDEIVREMTA
jgi:hypothetical protein